jgi:hypothetical protein
VRRALVFVLASACVPQEPVRAPEVVLPLTAPPAVAVAPSSSAGVPSPFAGQYQGSLGFIVLEPRDGALVSAGSPTTLRCVGLGDLECTWKADGEHGWAKLRLDDSANLRGEWGKDGATLAAGTWVLLRVDPQAAEQFAGDYSSSYGDVKLEQHGADVSATYPNGTMACVARGPHLACSWDEGGSVGRAILTRQPRGNIVGTWGYGSSDTDGGAWTLERK